MPSRVVLVRHLTRSFASAAVGRGQEISQLLGSFQEEGRRGLRYATIWPASRFERIRVRIYEVEDLGPGTLPMDEFPGFYPPDDFEGIDFEDIGSSGWQPDADRRDQYGGRTIAVTDSAGDALEIAEHQLGARLDRWVNAAVLLDEYHDYLQQGRPLGTWSTG
jgi:hypothetical protein